MTLASLYFQVTECSETRNNINILTINFDLRSRNTLKWHKSVSHG